MATLGEMMTAQQRAAMAEVRAQAAPVAPLVASARQALKETLQKAEREASSGNPVRARQHILRAMRLLEEQP